MHYLFKNNDKTLKISNNTKKNNINNYAKIKKYLRSVWSVGPCYENSHSSFQLVFPFEQDGNDF